MESCEVETFKGYGLHWTRYTKKEIKEAWNKDGQGHFQAIERGDACIVVPCDEGEAIILSALFVRNVFAIPTCTHYDGKTLSLYCGDAGSRWKDTMENCKTKILIYKLAGIDEQGALFSNEL